MSAAQARVIEEQQRTIKRQYEQIESLSRTCYELKLRNKAISRLNGKLRDKLKTFATESASHEIVIGDFTYGIRLDK